MKRIACIAAALAVTACANFTPQISGNPEATALKTIAASNPTAVTDLQDAASNLDQGVIVGALAADDPAPTCVHSILQKAGIEVPAGTVPPASFTPKNSGPASAGAIVYIIAQQAKQRKGGITVDPSCEALVGRIVIDGVSAANKAALAIAIIK